MSGGAGGSPVAAPAWRRWRSAWNRFWFADVDGRPFGLARIGIALAGLQLWTGTIPLVHEFYSDAGQYPVARAREWGSEWALRFLMPEVLGAYPVALLLFVAWGGLLVALLVGWRTRFAAVGAWLLTIWFHFRNPTFGNGGDEVFRLATLYLAAAYLFLPPAERAFSLDRRRWLRHHDGGSARPARMPAWPLRLLQIQLCIVYVVAGFWKVVGPPWWDGSALYYALANPSFSRFGVPDWRWLQVPFTVLTFAVAWWEFLFPVLVSRERTRRGALVFGVALHGGILLTMNIGVFSFVMLGFYPVFLRPAEAEAIARRVRRLLPSVRQRSGGKRSRSNPTASVASS